MNFIQITKQAFANMKAVPVSVNGKRNGNKLNVPYHAYAKALQEIGYNRFDAYRIASGMKQKF